MSGAVEGCIGEREAALAFCPIFVGCGCVDTPYVTMTPPLDIDFERFLIDRMISSDRKMLQGRMNRAGDLVEQSRRSEG
jgi:hypothetical protein